MKIVEQVKSSHVVEPAEIEDDFVARVAQLVAEDRTPALSLEGKDTYEGRITVPVTKESLAADIEALRASASKIPLPWRLNIVCTDHPPITLREASETCRLESLRVYVIAEFVQ